MTSLLFAIGTLTSLCGLMCLYAWLFESNRPIWPDEDCDADYPQPGGQPQWRDE